MQSMTRQIERLDERLLMAGDLANDLLADEPAAHVIPQYTVNHPPRLQPGDMPLAGTPAYDGFDRLDLVWQTLTVGEGDQDSFDVKYRKVGDALWTTITDPIHSFEAISAPRVMHSATLQGLDWNSGYEYQVNHLRGGEVVETFANSFRTRLKQGDEQAFSFAAYGDSANAGPKIVNFRAVQDQINQQDLDFSVLLGDNVYTFGTHNEADHRMKPSISPEAADWTARKMDYFGVGNHDFFVEMGQTSRDLYAVPTPVAGRNAHASLPSGEFAEHSYSFDYGNTHFVTFDTNLVDFTVDPIERETRINRLLDYVVADLAASDAQWKIVYGHHPFIGTEKRMSPDDVYFKAIMERLGNADVDLVMLAHSHSVSWTYPMTGFSDRDENGTITMDEVEFVRDDDQSYTKGAGLIQSVTGVGGGSLRSTTYDEPMFAQGFSLHESTGPLEHGFTRVDVTPSTLTVSYISAATGEIMGDTNANGRRDTDELFFGKFEIVDPNVASPDVNQDGEVDSTDIDALFAAIRENSQHDRFDLDSNQQIERADVDYLLRSHLDSLPGDANLDGLFNSQDLVTVFQAAKYEDGIPSNSGWAEGDWDGDGDFTSRDFVAAFRTGGYSIASRAVTSGILNSRIAARFSNLNLDDTIGKSRFAYVP